MCIKLPKFCSSFFIYVNIYLLFKVYVLYDQHIEQPWVPLYSCLSYFHSDWFILCTYDLFTLALYSWTISLSLYKTKTLLGNLNDYMFREKTQISAKGKWLFQLACRMRLDELHRTCDQLEQMGQFWLACLISIQSLDDRSSCIWVSLTPAPHTHPHTPLHNQET